MFLSLFPALSTSRIVADNDGLTYTNDMEGTIFFQHEGLVAALAVSYCRFTVKSQHETIYVRLASAALLGYLAFIRSDYWLLTSVHACTYSCLIYRFFCKRIIAKESESMVKPVPNPYKEINEEDSAVRAVKRYANVIFAVVSTQLGVTYILYSCFQPHAAHSFFQSRVYQHILHPYILSTNIFHHLTSKFYENISYLIPIAEVLDAYNLLIGFVQPHILHAQMSHLLFVTIHIQVGRGFLGINFLTREQERKNSLIRLEDEVPHAPTNDGNYQGVSMPKSTTTENISKKFNRGAATFIIFSAVPYMFQIIFYGGLNMFAYNCFKDDLYRTIRLHGLFENDGERFVATASASGTSYRSPGEYARNIEIVVSTVYDMANRRLFSIPKLVLLPQMIAKQPMLVVKVFPFILMSDYIKSTMVAAFTTEYERVKVVRKNLEAKRTRIEQFDLKNSDLIQRSGYSSIPFTKRRWTKLTEEIQNLEIRSDIIKRSRMWFNNLQYRFIMVALVDCALVKLILVGKIMTKEILVYQRAIEDAIDLLLTRSRAESELASMATSIDVLNDLKVTWLESENQNLVNCSINNARDAGRGQRDFLEIKEFAYTRGAATVQTRDLVVKPGIYAVTGANGSGKSTLFRVIMSCDTNKKSINLDNSISIDRTASINMPSSDVVEITQNFYWPLFTIPVDWMYQIHLTADVTDDKERERMITRVEEALQSLNFYQEMQPEIASETSNAPTNREVNLLRSDLTENKEDWFEDLSGGQKSKVELVRKVFLADECPKILLIDETFAPLDPDSKSLVMGKLKDFCSNSIVLVIYHADVEIDEKREETEEDACVRSSNFFDGNLHVKDGILSIRSVCTE